MCNVFVGGRTIRSESVLPYRAHNNTEESFSKRGLFITSGARSSSGDFGCDRYFAFTLEAVEARQTVVSRLNLKVVWAKWGSISADIFRMDGL